MSILIAFMPWINPYSAGKQDINLNKAISIISSSSWISNPSSKQGLGGFGVTRVDFVATAGLEKMKLPLVPDW